METAGDWRTLALLEHVRRKHEAGGPRAGRHKVQRLGAGHRVAGALVGQRLAVLAQQCGQPAGSEGCVSVLIGPSDGGKVNAVGEHVSGVLRPAPVLVLGDSAPRAVMAEADSHRVWLLPVRRTRVRQ